jgi:hypothetical protein
MPGLDANTKLMLHGNGADASTTIIDDSLSAHLPVVVNQAQIDTAQSQFGGAAILFDGAGDRVTVPDSTDWDFGTDDITIDFWVRFNVISGNQGLCGRGTNGVSYFYFAYEGSNNMRFRDYNSGNIIDLHFGNPGFSAGTWYHIALSRSGSNFRLFVDGVQFGSTLTSAASFLDRSVDFEVGGIASINYFLNGHIDEFRVTKGKARWVQNFIVPQVEYDSLDDIHDDFTKLMLHCNGTDTSTSFPDESQYNQIVTAVGDAQVDTADSQFGGASLLLDGAGDGLSIPHGEDWVFGTGDFTLDFWINFDTLTNFDNMISIYDDGGNNRCLFYANADGSIKFFANSGGVTIADFSTPVSAVTTGTWTHIALVREGANEFIFIDGISQSLTYTVNPDGTTDYPDVNTIFRIGYQNFGFYIDGHMDEIRVSKGIARWNANFTPPTLEYGSDTLVDINTDIRARYELAVEDINTDIRTVNLNVEDINTDIRIKHTEALVDVNTDIRALLSSLNDLNTDIRIQFNPVTVDVNTDIRARALSLNDINTDIRIQHTPVISDINTDIRAKATIALVDINTDIRVAAPDPNFGDISTDIRAYHVIPISLVNVVQLSFKEGVFLNTNTVNLEMEVYGAVRMQFRNEDELNFSALEVYNEEKLINLSAGDGDKAVYVRFQDILGNFTSGNDNIQGIVQTAAPLEPTIEAYTDETLVTPIVDSVYTNDNNPLFQWSIPISDIPYEVFIFSLDDPIDNATSGNLATPDIVRDGILLSKATPLPEMTLETTDGFYYYGADLKEYNAQSITLDDGGLLDRIDLVYISAINESLNIEKGVESATPVVPDVPQDGIVLATAYVPASETLIANVTLTDIRETKVVLNQYLNQNIDVGQHVFRVKGVLANDVESSIAEFNLYISNPSPDMGEVLGYTDFTKVTQLANGVYQTATSSVFLEWTASPAEPGPIQYHYTTDGSEPTLASPFTSSTSITLGPFPEGSTVISIKPFDTVSGNSGQTRSFNLVFGSQDFTNDTAVIVGGTVLRQSLKEVEVKSIQWDFDSARSCRIFVPVLFDETIPIDIGTSVTVVYGSGNDTVFIGTVKIVERIIDAGKEMIMCNCVGPRGKLNECFAVINDIELGNTAQIEFDDIPIVQALTTITNTAPNVIKRIDSFPSGANVSDRFIAQSISQVISRIYERTKFRWYMKPDGTLVSVDLTADNPGEAKFGIFGTTVNSLTPQFNVMASNLQFDITNRYSKAVIEGARKRELISVSARCGTPPLSEETLVNQNDRASGSQYKIFTLNTDQKVVKVIETFVTYGRIKQMTLYPIPTSNVGGGISSFNITLNEWEVCRNNKLIKFTRRAIYNTAPSSTDGTFNRGSLGQPLGVTLPLGASSGIPRTSKLVGFAATPTSTEFEEVQGTLGPNNTIRFSREMYNFWPTGTSLNTGGTIVTRPGLNIKEGVPNYFWRNPPKKKCASVRADVLIETQPLRVEVSSPGTADTDKVLRIVKTQFKYDEDPDNLIDDTAEMTQYALDALEEFKDIKINGTIVLDTVDVSWDLNKTVNLINTQQGSWSSLNITIVGIEFDFTENTTTLEITSEYLT